MWRRRSSDITIWIKFKCVIHVGTIRTYRLSCNPEGDKIESQNTNLILSRCSNNVNRHLNTFMTQGNEITPLMPGMNACARTQTIWWRRSKPRHAQKIHAFRRSFSMQTWIDVFQKGQKNTTRRTFKDRIWMVGSFLCLILPVHFGHCSSFFHTFQNRWNSNRTQ